METFLYGVAEVSMGIVGVAGAVAVTSSTSGIAAAVGVTALYEGAGLIAVGIGDITGAFADQPPVIKKIPKLIKDIAYPLPPDIDEIKDYIEDLTKGTDTDGDGIPDSKDPADDNDGIPDEADDNPKIPDDPKPKP